jgi:hypothetical protein
MVFQLSLESGMSLSPKTNTHGEFSVSTEGQGHVPLPRVKVVAFLRDRYKLVMSTSRQTNGAHGFATSALSPKSEAVICHASKERFGADLQISGITHGMSTNTFEIHQSLRSIASRKKAYLI